MTSESPPSIRPSQSSEAADIEALYRAVFSDEDLVPLIRRLLAEHAGVVSLVALAGGAIVGHVMLTTCSITGSGVPFGLLGPLGVHPEFQGRGIGRALIGSVIQAAASSGFGCVLVLGDPGYYSRHGFSTSTRIKAPCPLPAEWRTAWQARTLSPAGEAAEGELTVPEPWRDPALWLP